MNSFAGVIAACALAGALTVGATLRLGHVPAEGAHGVPAIATEDYGRRLLAQALEGAGRWGKLEDHLANPENADEGTSLVTALIMPPALIIV